MIKLNKNIKKSESFVVREIQTFKPLKFPFNV